MLGDSSVLEGAAEGGGGGDAVAASASASVAGGGGAAAAGAGTHDGGETAEGAAAAAGGGVGSNSGDEGERSFGGNRWPRQETLALIGIRSEMNAAFRDASVKGPLWDEVCRKMAELGYHRSAKKCKEKFENVHKYHKRTKEGRSGKPDGKMYRFFDQLEALAHQNHSPIQSPNPSKPPSQLITTTFPMPPVVNTAHVTVPSTTTIPTAMPQGIVTAPSRNLTIPSFPPPSTANPTIPLSFPDIPTELLSNSSSSSTSSDEALEEGRRKRKRKWKDFSERLMKEVIVKQEELQKRFLEAVERREQERMVREESWRLQEMQRINKEREILERERSIAAAKDAAVMSLLQQLAEKQNLGQALNSIINIIQPQPQSHQQQRQPQPQPLPQLTAPASSALAPAPSAAQQPLAVTQAQHGPPAQPVVLPLGPQQVTNMEMTKAENKNNNHNNGGENLMPASSSRWPKSEVQALIKLRTSMDAKYQENGPKGPLWEEISAAMRKIGYNRSSKRCKEKWENINKYFKKVKESNKKRPEDSKTCPYFHQLDALYRQKNNNNNNKLLEGPSLVKPESMLIAAAPLMVVRPEQQWPPQQEMRQPPPELAEVTMEEAERRHEEEDDEDDEDDEDKNIEDEDDEEDEGDGNYEIVASKPPAPASSVGASAE